MSVINPTDPGEIGAAQVGCTHDRQDVGSLLTQWLHAPAGAELDRTLAGVLDEAVDPVIRRIIRRKFGKESGAHDAEDVASEARFQLIEYLLRLRAKPAADGDPPVIDLPAYTATVVYSVWANHLRRRYPKRAMLLNRLRHLLSNRAGPSGFALWAGAGGVRLAGFSAWEEEKRALEPTPRRQWLLSDPAAAAADAFRAAGQIPADLARLTAGLLDWLGGPLELRDLTGVLVELLGLREPGDSGAGDSTEGEFATPDPRPSPHETLRWKEYLGWLWREVMTLPLRQRTAFLCHSSLLREMEIIGLTSIRAAAAALEISPELMAEIWTRLPLNDLDIAALLGNDSTRQQIINLRKVARTTLGEAWQASLKT